MEKSKAARELAVMPDSVWILPAGRVNNTDGPIDFLNGSKADYHISMLA
jgi:hypothetical protein